MKSIYNTPTKQDAETALSDCAKTCKFKKNSYAIKSWRDN